MSTPMTYAGAGVDYAGGLDRFKIKCQERARLTDGNISRLGFKVVRESRGESVFLIHETTVDRKHRDFGHVEEGTGTKNIVADDMRKITGKTYYDRVLQCNGAMSFNDEATLGVVPLTFALHVAAGHSDWFNDEERQDDVIQGTGKACDLARCVWGPGETPVLKGIIDPRTVLLSGSSMGICKHHRLDSSNIQEGDVIVFLESSGIHANGLTLARSIADKLPKGYATLLPNGNMYGEELLKPTHIYCDFIEDCLDRGININYAVNITGHGWRKLMRAPQSFSYIIDKLPPQLPIFEFMQEHGPITDEEAYGNLNMGAGFALFLPMSEWLKIVVMYHTGYEKIARYHAFQAGYIEKSPVKKVVIRPKGLEFAAETLALR